MREFACDRQYDYVSWHKFNGMTPYVGNLVSEGDKMIYEVRPRLFREITEEDSRLLVPDYDNLYKLKRSYKLSG